jgi:hypothetical protein
VFLVSIKNKDKKGETYHNDKGLHNYKSDPGMGYNGALVTVRHPPSHDAAITTVPLLLEILIFTRRPESKSEAIDSTNQATTTSLRIHSNPVFTYCLYYFVGYLTRL